MNKIFLPLIVSLVLFSCIGNEHEGLKINKLPNTMETMQKQIVGQLSGEISVYDNIKIKSRWSSKDRQLSRIYLEKLIEQIGLEPEEQAYKMPNLNPAIDLILSPFNGVNVYTILPATESTTDYILLGAHYDSSRDAPGAIDNATGTTLIYSVVKDLKKLKYRNQHIILVFFDQEEEENIGSKAFIKYIKQHNWNITSVHCFDMVGWDENNDSMIETYTVSEQLQSLYSHIAIQQDVALNQHLISPIAYHRSSTDFDEFVRNGYTVVGAGECYFTGDTTPYKDSPKDTYKTVNFKYLQSSTSYIYEVIKYLISST